MNNKYKMILLKEQQKIGKIIVKSDFSEITIQIAFSRQNEYSPVFEKVIKDIIEKREMVCYYNDFMVKNCTSIFWKIFVQTLMRNLGILIVEDVQ